MVGGRACLSGSITRRQLAPTASGIVHRNCTPCVRVISHTTVFVQHVHTYRRTFSPGYPSRRSRRAPSFCEMSSTVHYDGLNVFEKTVRTSVNDRARLESRGEPVRGIARTGKSGSESGKICFFEITQGTEARS